MTKLGSSAGSNKMLERIPTVARLPVKNERATGQVTMIPTASTMRFSVRVREIVSRGLVVPQRSLVPTGLKFK